jgi:AraC-like DNA-binding protein
LDSLPLTLLDAALRGTLVALLVLLALVLLRERPHLPVAQAAAALALGLCVQVVSSTPLFEARVPGVWQAPWVAVSVGNAVLFWVFAQALFDDEFSWRPLHAVAWLMVAALSGFNCAVMAHSASIFAPFTFGLQRLVPLLFAALAAWAAASQWRADLVEGRRRLRAFTVATGVVYTLATLVARLGSPLGQLTGATAMADVVILLAIVAVIGWRLLGLGIEGARLFAPVPAMVVPEDAVDAELPAPTPAPPAAPDPAEDRLAAALQHAMAEERLYRGEDLSLASVAARLAVPEYRLRRLINQRLGHRNFNAFVNGFRLADARTALADPALSDTPVLTIALDAGFQSIGPFNRAFKAATGLTPTEFRRQKQAVS